MMNTLSLFPMKTAQPPLVGKTARTCTSITVLFIRANRNRAEEEKQAGAALRNRARAPARARSVFRFDHEQEHEHDYEGEEIFQMRTCMSAALIDYALRG